MKAQKKATTEVFIDAAALRDSGPSSAALVQTSFALALKNLAPFLVEMAKEKERTGEPVSAVRVKLLAFADIRSPDEEVTTPGGGA